MMMLRVITLACNVVSIFWMFQITKAEDVSDVPSADPTLAPQLNSTRGPTVAPSTPPPTSRGEYLEPECSAHSACAGLIDNCCPTIDDVFLCESIAQQCCLMQFKYMAGLRHCNLHLVPTAVLQIAVLNPSHPREKVANIRKSSPLSIVQVVQK